jgi:uncharacterized protein YggU (UPF0235/DUF167 family)
LCAYSFVADAEAVALEAGEHIMRNPLPILVGIQDLEFRIKVVTGSSRSEIVGACADGALKIRVAATEESGRVNDELCAYLAKLYGVQLSAVTIRSGRNSPLKVVRIDTCTLAAAPPRPKSVCLAETQ